MEKLGLCSDFEPKKIYIGSRHGGIWYTKSDREGEFEELKVPGIRGYFVGAYAYEAVRREKECTKLIIGMDCGDENFMLEVGLETNFAKEFLLTIAQQSAIALKDPIVIAPQAGTQEKSLTFCRLYVNRIPVKYRLPYGSTIGEYKPSEQELRELIKTGNQLVGRGEHQAIEPAIEAIQISPVPKPIKAIAPAHTAKPQPTLESILRNIAPKMQAYGYNVSEQRIANFCQATCQVETFPEMPAKKQAEMLEKMCIDFCQYMGANSVVRCLTGLARSPETALAKMREFVAWLDDSPPPY